MLISTAQIIVGGDSAGGNLAIALMSNIMHPHHESRALNLSSPIAGLLLISSWVTFSTDAMSFKECEHRDIHGITALHEWKSDFAPPRERDNYMEPLQAEMSWWKNLPAKKVLNAAGEYEMFRDDLKDFGQVLEKAGVNVRTVICPMQVHIDCILDAQAGLDVGPMSTEIWEWLISVF